MNLSARSQPFSAELQVVTAMSFLLDLWLPSLHSKDISVMPCRPKVQA